MKGVPEPQCDLLKMDDMAAFAEIELVGKRIAASLIPSEKIQGEDATDTILLKRMAEDAKRYITSFAWCHDVLDSYFSAGVGGIFAIFFFHIRSNRPEVDPWIWIIVGDIPPAYLPVSDASSARMAFQTYLDGMSRWVEFARKGKAAAIGGTFRR